MPDGLQARGDGGGAAPGRVTQQSAHYRASPFAGECDETRRLAFLASRLHTAGTPIESWKLPLATEQRRID